VAEQEKLEVSEQALILIARQATGSMRDAISLLDQLASSGSRITLEMAQTVLGTATSQMVIELVEAVVSRNAAAGLECIHRALDSGSDPRQFARQIVDYLRNLLLVRLGNADQVDATGEQRTVMVRQSQAFEKDHLLETLQLFNGAASELRSGWQPGLPLELALAHAIDWAPAAVMKVEPPQAVPPRQASPSTGQPPETPAGISQAQSANPTSPAAASLPQASAEELKPQPRPDAAAAAPTEPVSESGPNKSAILQNWQKIRAVVKSKHTMAEGLLNSCKSVEIRNGVLQLGFASPVLKSKMEKDDNLKITRAAIKQVLGWDLPVVCVDDSGKGSGAPGDSDVDAEGMVNAALNLGGKIVQKE